MARKKLLLKWSAFRYCPEKYKIKRTFTFFRTRENADIFSTFDENIFGIHLKKVNILYISRRLL